jgi:hypothetical protein
LRLARRGPALAAEPRPAGTVTVYLFPLLVLVGALALATVSYCHFLESPRSLWDIPTHDRNAHYLLALSLAQDMRHADVAHFVRDINRARTWPPLHGLLAGLVLAVGGLDYRLALLPSLLAWVATAVLGFLVARRAVRAGGNIAGLGAALLILASPAYHAYATDIMLESLGACLSLLVIYCYMLSVQGGTVWAGRCLGLALTALFWHKYNYWLLIVLALGATELTTQPEWWRDQLGRWLAQVDWRRCARAEVRQPLNALIVLILVVLAWTRCCGPVLPRAEEFNPLSLRSPHNLVHAAYILVFLRMACWWWKRGATWCRALDVRSRQVVLWHAWPVALWFLWPQRLSFCLWFLSPANSSESQPINFAEGIRYYARFVLENYHAGLVSLALVLGLIVVAASTSARLKPGGKLLLWFVLISAGLTALHPNHSARYVHSWIMAGWVLAGIGLAELTNGRFARACGWNRPWCCGAALAGVALACVPGLLVVDPQLKGEAHAASACTLDITDSYLPYLAESARPAIFSTVQFKFLARWTFLERFGRQDCVEACVGRLGPSAEQNRACFEHWLGATSCDRLVFIDVRPESCFYEPPSPSRPYGQLRDLIADQSVFRRTKELPFPQYGCTVTVWDRQAK